MRLVLAIALAACNGSVSGVDPRDAGERRDAPSRDGAIATRDAGSRDSGTDGGTDAQIADPGTEGDGDFTIGPDYTPAPETMVPPGTPRGRIYAFSMDSADSAIFPGVTGPYTRNVWVYIPQQYVDGTDAPFMVVQDGGGYRDRMSAVLDTMIAARRLPHIVAIFINPGPGDGRGSERGLEYDRVSEHYTTFIETEVLPLVPTIPEIATDYPALSFTSDPEGRGSMGGSSGGACAFTMGWFRPDLYRRILTYSGTFVNQHPDATYPGSAWEYHTHLIADEERKPLRVFLEVGENDLNLDGSFGDGMHDWVAANRAMAAALAAKGYHYRFLFAENAGHVDGGVLAETLPETLEWLWRGYPIP